MSGTLRHGRSISIRDIDPSLLGPNSPLHELMKRARRAPAQDLEHQEQVKLFEWAEENLPVHPELFWLFAVPNFSGFHGKRNARLKSGARLKAEGRKAGVLDVWFPVKRGTYPGLVIEMKAGKNKPTPEQREWIEHLLEQGWKVIVAYSSEQAIKTLEWYLSLEEK